MKIIIIVGGKFHAFNLAREINKKKYLASIITSYPKYLVKQYGIDTNRIKSIILKEILSIKLAQSKELNMTLTEALS